MHPTEVVLFFLPHSPYVWQRVGMRAQEKYKKRTRKKKKVGRQQDGELV